MENDTDKLETSPFCIYIYENIRVNSRKLRLYSRNVRVISREI